jgi:predicted  nucleic acid-binding Zn-ribbon protein
MPLIKSMPKPPAPPRPALMPQRAVAQQIRHQGQRQAVNAVQPLRVRPVARPVAPPLKVMPKAPPAPQALKVVRRPAAPVAAIGAVGATAAVGGFLAVNAASANPQISAEAQALQASISDLQRRSSFTDIVSEINALDAAIQRANDLLEGARQKGYAFQGDLETIIYDASGQWQSLRPQVMDAVNQQSMALQGQLAGVNPQIQSVNRSLNNPAAAATQVRNAQTYVNGLLSNISRIENDLRARIDPLESGIQGASARLTTIHWGLDQLAQAKFALQNGEDLAQAVQARWDKEGKEDPEGVLYLTSQRLIFERKEKVATKKVLFITTASELVQETLIDQPLSGLQSYKAESKGLFGHQDFLLVQFGEASLGAVSLHLNGQDSKEWAALLDRARSGKLQAERVNASAGLSMSDMTRPLTSADIVAMQNEVNQIQDEMMLREARQQLAGLEMAVGSLERDLGEVRAHGYTIEKSLEGDIAILKAQWNRVQAHTTVALNHQTQMLNEQMAQVNEKMAHLAGSAANLAAARPVYMQLKSALAAAEAQADAAEATVTAQFDLYEDEVSGLQAHLEWIEWMLQALSSASFRLQATENGVAAVEAVFVRPSMEAENGVLFLTDQRLLWEDRVGAYELRVDVPISDVLDVKKDTPENAEFEFLVVQFGAKGPLPVARFQLAQPVADEWIQMVNRARSGGYAGDVAVPVSKEELERLHNAPQQCSNCGAAHTAPILRGQSEVTCEYCGLVTRL